MATITNTRISISIPDDLLKQVDELADQDYTSRSDIIRQALLDKVREQKARTAKTSAGKQAKDCNCQCANCTA